MERYIALALLVLVIGLFWFLRRPSIKAAEAHRLVASGARLVDVRTRMEFSAGHLPGASNIPLNEIGSRLGELGPPDHPVVLYCASGARSAVARQRLRRAGFSRVYNLGTMANW